MKTSDSIAEQDERKQAKDNGDSLPTSTQPGTQKHRRGDASHTARIAKWKWQKGFAPNPTGKNGHHDLAAEIARACFEENAEAVFKAFSKALLHGNAYAFKELADRAWGKLKERHEVEIGLYAGLSDVDLAKRIRELETKLGVPHSEPELLPPADDDSTKKPN